MATYSDIFYSMVYLGTSLTPPLYDDLINALVKHNNQHMEVYKETHYNDDTYVEYRSQVVNMPAPYNGTAYLFIRFKNGQPYNGELLGR